MVVSVTSIVEVGEAVQEDAVTLVAFIDLQQAAFAHCGVELAHGYAQRTCAWDVAYLVVVMHELVSRQAYGQKMVGDEAVQQVVFVLVVLVPFGFRVDVLAFQILHNVLWRDTQGFLPQQFAPYAVRFCEIGVAVIAVLRRTETRGRHKHRTCHVDGLDALYDFAS